MALVLGCLARAGSWEDGASLAGGGCDRTITDGPARPCSAQLPFSVPCPLTRSGECRGRAWLPPVSSSLPTSPGLQDSRSPAPHTHDVTDHPLPWTLSFAVLFFSSKEMYMSESEHLYCVLF